MSLYVGDPFWGIHSRVWIAFQELSGQIIESKFHAEKSVVFTMGPCGRVPQKRIAGIWFGPRSLHFWPDVAVVLRCKNHLKLNGYCYRKGTLAKFRRISFSVITTRITFKANRYTTSTFHHWIVAHPGAFSGIDRSGLGEKLIDSNGTFN